MRWAFALKIRIIKNQIHWRQSTVTNVHCTLVSFEHLFENFRIHALNTYYTNRNVRLKRASVAVQFQILFNVLLSLFSSTFFIKLYPFNLTLLWISVVSSVRCSFSILTRASVILNEFLFVGKANWYADAMIFALQSNISNYVLEIECDIKKAIYFHRCLNVTRAHYFVLATQRKYSHFL